jgi:hypothetical protein
MPRAYAIDYHGDVLNLRELAERSGLHYGTLKRWHATGVLSCEKIDGELALRELRETAVRNNVSMNAAAQRRLRGWSALESYTVTHRGRRMKEKTCHEHG